MIWSQFGLKDNPYFWRELGVSEDGYRFFVGRENDFRKFAINVAESDGCVVAISGMSGVGKTSFANVNQFALFTELTERYAGIQFELPKILPAFRKIQIESDEPIENIYLKVLSGCVYSIAEACKKQKVEFPKALNDLKEYVNRVVSESSGKSFGVSGFGFGANFTGSGGRSLADSARSRELTFLEHLDQLGDVVHGELGYSGIAVVLDNLDIVSPLYLTRILEYFRDSLFSKRHFWWFLLGPIGLQQFIRANVPRLSGVMKGVPIDLAPLPLDDLERLLDCRLAEFSFPGSTAASPVPKEVIRYLYKQSGGDIRFAFQLSEDVVRRTLYSFPSVTRISNEQAAEHIANVTRELFETLLVTPEERFILAYLIRKPDVSKIRPQDFNKLGLKSLESCAATMDLLVSKRLLIRDASPATGVTYVPRGYTSLAQALELARYLPSFSMG